MPQLNKEQLENRGRILQKWYDNLSDKYGSSYAISILERWMEDPVKLRILNALAAQSK